MKICTIEGCNAKSKSRKLCQKHYVRWRRTGSAEDIDAGKESHGMTLSDEYRIWCAMKTRCSNKNTINYGNYGGRGIEVCGEWQLSFTTFYEHMGPRPSKDYSIDRIDNDGDYEPGNCRWATRTEQNMNQRLRSDNTSGIVGVIPHKETGMWVAQLRNRYLGIFRTKEEAKVAREAAL